MPKDAYYINEDIDYGYAESLIRTSARTSETNEETAQRVLDDRLLAIWVAGKDEEREALASLR